jgi:hypothetical protein
MTTNETPSFGRPLPLISSSEARQPIDYLLEIQRRTSQVFHIARLVIVATEADEAGDLAESIRWAMMALEDMCGDVDDLACAMHGAHRDKAANT